MDPRFAQIYGLVNNNQLEKTAQEMLNEQISESTGVDMSSVDPEQLEQFAQQMLSESEAEQAAATKDFANMTPEQLVQTEEVQTGDVIGKTAAYAMYATLIPALDQYFNTKLAGFSDTMRKGYDAAKGGVSSAANAVTSAAKAYGHQMAGGKKVNTSSGPSRAGNSLMALGQKAHRKDFLASNATRAGTGLAAIGLGGGAYSATKEASALETMAYQKALNVLAQNGIDINALQQEQTQEQVQPQMQPQQQVDPAMKMANDYRALVDQYTDQLAMQMLQNSGFQFQQEQEVDPAMMNQNTQAQGVSNQQFVG